MEHSALSVVLLRQRLVSLLKAGEIECKLTDDLMTARWQKAVWNAVFNPISILGGVLDTAAILRTEADQAFVRKAMNEVCAVAAAAGHPLHSKLVDRMIADTRALPGYKTSMALDYENSRPMEIEAILGNVVRAGQKLNVPIPALESVYAVAKMVEGKRA